MIKLDTVRLTSIQVQPVWRHEHPLREEATCALARRPDPMAAVQDIDILAQPRLDLAGLDVQCLDVRRSASSLKPVVKRVSASFRLTATASSRFICSG
jgi:hypothetical protein